MDAARQMCLHTHETSGRVQERDSENKHITGLACLLCKRLLSVRKTASKLMDHVHRQRVQRVAVSLRLAGAPLREVTFEASRDNDPAMFDSFVPRSHSDSAACSDPTGSSVLLDA